MSFKICSDNLVDQSTITPSTVNALFPVSNLKDNRRSKVFRSTTNSDSIIFDFQETSKINTVFIVADKRAGFGISTAVIEFNATSNFTSPAYSIAVPFSTKFGIGFVEFPNTVEYRFARLRVTSSLGYCEVSKLFIGEYLDMERSIGFGWSIKDDELSTKSFNRYGQMFSDVIIRQKTITITYKLINKDDLDLINSMLDAKGETKPFYIILGCDNMVNDNRRFSGPVYLNDTPSIVNSHFNRYGLTLTMKEAT